MTLVRAVRTVGGGFGEAEKDEDVVEFPRQSLVVADSLGARRVRPTVLSLIFCRFSRKHFGKICPVKLRFRKMKTLRVVLLFLVFR